jgi:hypothetical protein
VAGRTDEPKWKRIVASVKAGSKGGNPGQWSARKAQLATLRYKKSGGGYSGPKTKAQKSLTKWTGEKWRTSDGKPAKRKGGTTRYLPDAAWKNLSPSEKAATNRAKRLVVRLVNNLLLIRGLLSWLVVWLGRVDDEYYCV